MQELVPSAVISAATEFHTPYCVSATLYDSSDLQHNLVHENLIKAWL